MYDSTKKAKNFHKVRAKPASPIKPTDSEVTFIPEPGVKTEFIEEVKFV